MDDLLHWVAEGSNIFGLMIYSAGMFLLVGTLVLANHADHRRDRQEQSASQYRYALNTAVGPVSRAASRYSPLSAGLHPWS
jgi:hypothetical protein